MEKKMLLKQFFFIVSNFQINTEKAPHLRTGKFNIIFYFIIKFC